MSFKHIELSIQMSFLWNLWIWLYDWSRDESPSYWSQLKSLPWSWRQCSGQSDPSHGRERAPSGSGPHLSSTILLGCPQQIQPRQYLLDEPDGPGLRFSARLLLAEQRGSWWGGLIKLKGMLRIWRRGQRWVNDSLNMIHTTYYPDDK